MTLKAHLNFINAGAEVLVANTYQANVPLLMESLKYSNEEARKAVHDPLVFAQEAIRQDRDDNFLGQVKNFSFIRYTWRVCFKLLL